MSNAITLSVSHASMRVIPHAGHGTRSDKALVEVREALLGQARFAHRCHFCDLAFGNVADECEVHHLDGDHGNLAAANLVPACVCCHMPHHLELATKRWPDNPGLMIFLPEMTQADLSALLHAIAFSLATQAGEMRPGEVRSVAEATGLPVYPYAAYNRLVARSVQVEAIAPGASRVREGASSPAVMARVLQNMTPEQYARRGELLAGVRYLPPIEPLIDLAKQWAVDGGAFSRLDLASWTTIHSPEATVHGG